MFHAYAEQTGAEANVNWFQHKSLHVYTYVVAERRWSGSKIHSTTNGFNTQFSIPASKLNSPCHFCPQQMVDLPMSAPCMWEHTRGNEVEMSKSTCLCSITTPPLCACVNIPLDLFQHLLLPMVHHIHHCTSLLLVAAHTTSGRSFLPYSIYSDHLFCGTDWHHC